MNIYESYLKNKVKGLASSTLPEALLQFIKENTKH